MNDSDSDSDTDTDTVTVYSFLLLQDGVELARQATFKATRELIKATHCAQILEGTGERVPTSALDAQGHFKRIATGWGEL